MSDKKLVGSCLIGQSGGPTAVINASAYGLIEAALQNEAITKVYAAHYGISGVLNDQLMIMDEEDPENLRLMLQTPAAVLGSCRYKMTEPEENDKDYRRLLEIFQKYDIRYFFYNGGNDSMDTCNKISRFMRVAGWACRVIGIPKTIDNDLTETDHCPGFASAAKYIATSIMEVARDSQAYEAGMITVIECMGRHAGWLPRPSWPLTPGAGRTSSMSRRSILILSSSWPTSGNAATGRAAASSPSPKASIMPTAPLSPPPSPPTTVLVTPNWAAWPPA